MIMIPVYYVTLCGARTSGRAPGVLLVSYWPLANYAQACALTLVLAERCGIARGRLDVAFLDVIHQY